MLGWFFASPGRLYVLATLLPLVTFFALLIVGGVRRNRKPSRIGAYLSLASMIGATTLAFIGLVKYLGAESPQWAESFAWVSVASVENDMRPAMSFNLGYRIDALTAIMFAMVTFIGTCIFTFSLGYMTDELEEQHTDHSAHTTRRGRYGRFFLYLSLFVFSMLNLLIADNLFQVFVSWELVGVCSFFLIGFYYERPSASTAANKAFIVNRIGDAGFLIGMAILFSTVGTLNFEEMFQRVRSPATDAHGPAPYADQMVKVRQDAPMEYHFPKVSEPLGDFVALHPIQGPDSHIHAIGRGKLHTSQIYVANSRPTDDFDAMPMWLLTIAGIGIFLGCVGKSAQFPLHTWLPDAMEGPTPVSALIHAATMVAAGVYLVARCYPLFTPDVLLVIAYTGAITMFIGATIALVMTDIKRVLAYSTVSQLGYMMLALGVGGWLAGLLHLLTHAFFKALLFLCSGSVIHGCHHEQDLRKMGGLLKKMPITAITMLIGVLAIIGTPFFSGWYSKDMIITSAIGFAAAEESHFLLAAIPLIVAVMTAFYMFRLWFLAFIGKPRDPSIHAHESPWLMTLPLIILAVCSVGIAWGWPIWDIEASYLAGLLHQAEPVAVQIEFKEAIHHAHENHSLGGILALIAAGIGVAIAVWKYALREYQPDGVSPFKRLSTFLKRKWYFDELYDATTVRPVLQLASASASIDKKSDTDQRSLDGLMSLPARLLAMFGLWLRVIQTGQIRRYVMALVLTAVIVLAILSF